MANSKRLTIKHTTGATVYAVIKRLADGYLMNDADGTFTAAPADPYKALTEDGTLKGIYTATESRSEWDSGEYLIAYYAQTGGSPSPVADTNLSTTPLQFVRFDSLSNSGDLSDRIMASVLPIVLSIKKAVDTNTVDAAILKKLEEIRIRLAEGERLSKLNSKGSQS